jgi:GNAT superfamily N-acetyltransferase
VLTPRQRSQAIEGIEAATARSLYGAAPAHVARDSGIAHERVGGADCFVVSASRHGYLNRALGLGSRRAATDAAIDRIVAWYRERGAPRLTLEVSPFARPADLGVRLVARGFRATSGTGKLWRGVDGLRSTRGEFPVRRLRQADAANWFAAFAEVFRHFRSRGDWFRQCLGRPGWRHFGAFDGDRIVGIGGLFVADGVGHLVEGATLKAYRRQGLQRRIIEARVRAGLRAGATLFTSETAAPAPRTPLISYRNLCRIGFELAYVRAGYQLELD